MKRRLLTIFYYEDIGNQHLYKDVGSIPLAFAKYNNWDATFAYVNFNGKIQDPNYEKYVTLMPIEKRGSAFFSISMFLLRNAAHYDVLNFYHLVKKHLLFLIIAKCRNPHIKIYVKTDMSRTSLNHLHKGKIMDFFIKVLDYFGLLPELCTVETKKYVKILNQTSLYKNRIQYLPNGFWSDAEIPIDLADKKENIILTVGRLGTRQKNTELLLDSFAEIPVDERKNWKLLLVGSYTREIFEKAEDMIEKDSSLRGNIVFTGNIENKERLNQYYTRAAVFCLSSRGESFGIALIEAIHHGCFPIVTDCCDAFYDMLDGGKYGNIIPNENMPVFTLALRKAMQDKAYIVNRGIQGKRYADQNFDWRKVIQRLRSYLEKKN